MRGELLNITQKIILKDVSMSEQHVTVVGARRGASFNYFIYS